MCDSFLCWCPKHTREPPDGCVRAKLLSLPQGGWAISKLSTRGPEPSLLLQELKVTPLSDCSWWLARTDSLKPNSTPGWERHQNVNLVIHKDRILTTTGKLGWVSSIFSSCRQNPIHLDQVIIWGCLPDVEPKTRESDKSASLRHLSDFLCGHWLCHCMPPALFLWLTNYTADWKLFRYVTISNTLWVAESYSVCLTWFYIQFIMH